MRQRTPIESVKYARSGARRSSNGCSCVMCLVNARRLLRLLLPLEDRVQRRDGLVHQQDAALEGPAAAVNVRRILVFPVFKHLASRVAEQPMYFTNVGSDTGELGRHRIPGAVLIVNKRRGLYRP